MRHKIILLVFITLLSVLDTQAQNHRFSGDESVKIDSIPSQTKQSPIEFGLHVGTAWTSGEVKEYAEQGTSFSIDLGVNTGRFYLGTELTFTSWSDYQDNYKTETINFEESTFLWLAHAKVFLGDGKVRPYIGLGTDLISLGEAILTLEDDDDYYYDEDNNRHEDSDYNAWIAPGFGLRWKMGSVQGNLGFTANFSKNYDFTRLQLGIVF